MFPLCSGQYLIKKLSKEGRAVNLQQGHGEPRLTVACGEQRLVCVVWSIRYWNQSFWKKLTLVLIESCQNTECIIMGLPMLTPVHRPKHQQWTRVRDALWEEGKLAQAVWCYVGKTWVLLSLWIFCFDMYHLPKHCWRPSTWACYSLMAGAIFSMHPATKQIWFSNDLRINKFEVLTWPPNSSDFTIIKHLWVVLDKQVRSMVAPHCNLRDLKYLLLTSRYHSFRGLGESLPRWVRAVLAAKGAPKQESRCYAWLVFIYYGWKSSNFQHLSSFT